MKKKLSFLLLLCILLFAFFYAKELHIVGGKSENGSPYKFYYEQLTETEKRSYDCILDRIYDMPEKIMVPYMNGDGLNDVFEALLADNPDLFFIGRKCSLNPGFMTDYFTVDYTMDKDEYLKKAKELEKVKKDFMKTLSAPDDEWQTELEIHDFIINNCKYDNNDTDYSRSSSYGALVDGKAACEGYSKAAKLLLDEAGIENGIVFGTAKNESGKSTAHMWNAVKINNKFYNLDCTWDDPVNDGGKSMRMYSYFNVSDEMISVSHSDFSYEYHCFSDDDNYFTKTGRFFDSFGASEKKTLEKLMIEDVRNGKTDFQIRFASRTIYNSAYSRLIKSGEISGIISAVNKETGRNISAKKIKYTENEKQCVIMFVLN